MRLTASALAHFPFRLLIAAALVGFLGALSSLFFKDCIAAVEHFLTGHSGSFVEVALELPWWKRLIVPAAGGAIAGGIMYFAPRFLNGRKSADYMEAIIAPDGSLPIRNSLLKCLSSLFSIASGGSLGREGSMIQLSALVADGTGAACRFVREHRKLLIACGASAGFASVYNAPLAGSLFIAEVILGSLSMSRLGPILLSAVVAAITAHHFYGSGPIYTLPVFKLTSNWELLIYLGMGVAAGLTGPLFIRTLQSSRNFFRRSGLSVPAAMALGGLITGGISVVCPEVWGNGHSVTNRILADQWLASPLLVILLCKILATASTTGSGAVGGVFTPTLFTGAALGAILGSIVHPILPHLTSDPSHYAAVGMGAFLAATTHAPFMAILMIFEMTLRYEIVLPLTLTSVLASFIARSIYPESIYAKQLDQQEKSSQAKN